MASLQEFLDDLDDLQDDEDGEQHDDEDAEAGDGEEDEDLDMMAEDAAEPKVASGLLTSARMSKVVPQTAITFPMQALLETTKTSSQTHRAVSRAAATQTLIPTEYP